MDPSELRRSLTPLTPPLGVSIYPSVFAQSALLAVSSRRGRAMMYKSDLGDTVVEGVIGGPPAASLGSLSTLSEVTKWIRIADTYPDPVPTLLLWTL